MNSIGDTTRLTLAGAALRLWALLLGIALLLAGNGLQGSLLGVVAEDAGFSSTITGLVMTAYFAGFLIGSTSAERFIGRVGHVRTFAALASLGSIAILVHGLYVEPITWVAMRFITGFSFAGLYVVAESWLNRESANEYRGGLMAIYMVVTHAGLAGGQALLNAAPTTSLTLYIISSIVISLALIPILLSSAPQPHFEITTERLTWKKLFKTSPLGVAGCFAAGVANGIVLGMSAVYARRLGFDVAAVSVFVAAIMVGGAVFQWPVGKLSDHFDRRRIIIGVAAASGVAAIILQLVSGNAVALTVAGFVAGGLVLTLYPLSLAYTNDWLSADQMIAGSTALVMIYGLGAVLGPIGTGYLIGLIGPSGYAFYLAALGFALTGYALYRATRREAPASQDDYTPAPAVMAAGEYWTEAAIEAADNAEDSGDDDPAREE